MIFTLWTMEPLAVWERRAKSSSECPNRWSDYEDPNSTLLDTFTRRIPINIQLPFFEKRPASEKSISFGC